MVLIIEGCALTGKQTLARYLQRDLPHFHWLPFNISPVADVHAILSAWITKHTAQDHLVVDFHLHHAVVHGKGGDGGLSDFDFWRIDHALAQHAVALVLLMDDPYDIAARVRAQLPTIPQLASLATPEGVGEVQNQFQRYLERSAIVSKWSFGLDQLGMLNDEGIWQPTTTYERLVALLQEDTGV